MTEASTDTIPTGIAIALHTDEIPVHEQHHPRRVPVTADRLPTSGRVGPVFIYPERRTLPTPPSRKPGMTVEPPSWIVSAEIERQHALWTRHHPTLRLRLPMPLWVESVTWCVVALAMAALGVAIGFQAGIARMTP